MIEPVVIVRRMAEYPVSEKFSKQWNKAAEDCTDRLRHIFEKPRDMSTWKDGKFNFEIYPNSKYSSSLEVERKTSGDVYIEKIFHKNSDYDVVRIYDKNGKLIEYTFEKVAYCGNEKSSDFGTAVRKYVMNIFRSPDGSMIQEKYSKSV